MKRAHFERLCPFSKSHAGSAGLSEPIYVMGGVLSFRDDFCVPASKGQSETKRALFLLSITFGTLPGL